MSSYKCTKCGTPLAFKYNLVCHVCNPDIAKSVTITNEHLKELKNNLLTSYNNNNKLNSTT